MKTFKEFINDEYMSEAIKGWKNAHTDIMKSRQDASNKDKSVKLVKLNKDGSESGMHDATKGFSSEEEAIEHHQQIRKLNPTRNIRHNLYVDSVHKAILSEGFDEDKEIESTPVGAKFKRLRNAQRKIKLTTQK